MAGLENIPKAKWETGTGNQVGLKGDMKDLEQGVLQVFDFRELPVLTWVDATQVKVDAGADSPAQVMMRGFPNVLHPGQYLDAGLSDGAYRVNTAAVSMDMDTATTLWGTEKSSQWYAILAIAADVDTDFDLKAMPLMRVQSQATQTISTGTNTDPSADIKYGLVDDELIGSYIYMLSGASKGLLREITDNDEDATDTVITYGGAALTVSQGDWFIVLPATNFAWLGDIYNSAGGNILQFTQVGSRIYWADESQTLSVVSSSFAEGVGVISPLAREIHLLRATSCTHSGSSAFFITDLTTVNVVEYDSGRSLYYYNGGYWLPIRNCRYKDAQTWAGWTAVIGGFGY